jgi:hypothetical protein
MVALDHPFLGDRGMVADLLTLFEQQHDDAGWGKTPAMVLRMSWKGETPLVVATPLGQREHCGHLTPREELLLMAFCFTDPELAAAMEEDFDRPPVAHCLLTEVKVQGLDGPDTTVEMRQGLAWVGEQRILLQRRRGGEPSMIDPGAAAVIGMDASLRDIHIAAVRHWQLRKAE